jgi:signal transduction histidine kinase
MVVALVPATIIVLRSTNIYSQHLGELVEEQSLTQEQADRQLGEIRTQALVYGGYGGAIALILGYFFAASLVNPIRSLQQGARQIGNGELDYRVESGSEDELAELADSINQMAASLQTRESELRQHSQDLSLLYQFAHDISESHHLNELLSKALNKALEISGSEQGCVYLVDGEGSLEPALCSYSDKAPAKRQTSTFDSAAMSASGSGEPVIVRYDGGETEMAVACVALVYEQNVQGAVCVAGKASAFTEDTMKLLSAISSETAVAIENSRLLDQLETQNRELSRATEEIASLIKRAEEKEGFGIRYQNPNLARCWEMKECTQEQCPSYMSEDLRCWQVAGTHCGGEVQGVFAQKLGRCEKCEVFLHACPDRLTVLGETFNNMMAALEQEVLDREKLQQQLFKSTKLAAIGELAAEVAHEINNPMTGILANAMLMKRADLDRGELQRKLEVIESEAYRTRDIVHNLLDFAHEESQFRPEPVDLAAILDQTVRVVEQQAALASVTIEMELDESLPQVVVDANHIKQVFLNIITNAIHAMPGGGMVRISAREGGGNGDQRFLRVDLSDTGTGMDEEKQARIFDPFFTTKQEGKGTGLGLAVSQRIISEHGGEITVKSEPGKGSTFSVTLPAKTAGGEQQDAA